MTEDWRENFRKLSIEHQDQWMTVDLAGINAAGEVLEMRCTRPKCRDVDWAYLAPRPAPLFVLLSAASIHNERSH